MGTIGTQQGTKKMWKATYERNGQEITKTAKTKRELLDTIGAWSATKVGPGEYRVYGGGEDPDVRIYKAAA